MRQVSGLYHHRGWRIEVGDDAEAADVLVASMHEAMHDRLQMTTIYGCTVALLQERATRDQKEQALAQAMALQRGSARVHEEYATWMSTIPAGWGVETLRQAFPIYALHLVRSQRRVQALHGPYLAMHATQAVARACMQPAALTGLLAAEDPSTLTAGMLDHTMRPDVRLQRLERALSQHGWGPLEGWVGDAVDMSPERFADESDPGWGELNRAAYEWCRALLESSGCPTLPYDGHLPHVDSLREAIGLPENPADVPSSLIALMSVESETLVLEDPLPAVVLPAGTPPAELLAGDGDRRHLFLAIRPRQRLLVQYQLNGGSLSEAPHVAVLRRVREDGTVEILDVTDQSPAAISGAGAVVVSIAMSSLAQETIQQYWKPLLGREQASVLCDLRPSVNLQGWLRETALTVRYAMVGIETRVGMVRLLVFQIEDGASSSRIYISPVSRLYSSGLLLWLNESQSTVGRARHDDTLGDLPLVRFSAAHILLEERLFSFAAGDTR
ncbi:hypothetical protein LN996_02635 [Arthrobacter sp. AK01]|uniref:hypothetical protein n=1 Tax=Arthrobacter sp. AK01 TaxID=2894084 RepID=UPI001E38285C|nr:hypothetical protein [Arthrobacter sp. AK01]MCD4849703.1 hypothetical protein [Arthrobacter sp. AK01]